MDDHLSDSRCFCSFGRSAFADFEGLVPGSPSAGREFGDSVDRQIGYGQEEARFQLRCWLDSRSQWRPVRVAFYAISPIEEFFWNDDELASRKRRMPGL
jgi:hypothetical protein